MNVQLILQGILLEAAGTVDRWRFGAIGLLLVVIAACAFTLAWLFVGDEATA